LNTPKDKQAQDDGVAMTTDQACGIPRGNTVVIVGDPGTGKTNFLLSYVTQAAVMAEQDEGKRWCGLVRLKAANRPAFEALDGLYRPAYCPELLAATDKNAATSDDDRAQSTPTLRCFISLENSFPRVLQNHGTLLSSLRPSTDEDQFLFVDATAFLSGRLEDRLRYPRLSGGNNGGGLPEEWKEQSHDFTLGGHGLDDDEHFGLYYQDPTPGTHEDPKRIEQLKEDTKPFRRDDEGIRIRCRSFNLITRPIPDPYQRVRLLKDLLAEIFVRFSGCQHRLLAIDSLSALLNPFGERDVSATASPARRLHILNLVRWLEEMGATTFLACEAEHDREQTWGSHTLFLGTEERYLASGVIQLHYHRYPSGDIVRYLRVLKMRGAAHDMRPHAYDLDANGIAWVEPLFGEAGNSR